MTYLYSENLISNLKKKKRTFLIILIGLVIFAVTFESVLIYMFSLEPYGTNKKIFYKLVMYSFAVLSVFGIIFFIEIYYKRFSKYHNLIIDCLASQKTTSEATVLRVNNDLNDKNGVEFTSIDLLEWSTIKNDYVERTISVDLNFKDAFKPDDMIKIITANGVLLAYEVKNYEKK